MVPLLLVCHASWPNEKRYRPEIWYTHSPRPNLKTAFFEKVTLRAASLEKLPCQVDFPHISSIAFFMYLFIYLCHASWQKEKRYRPEIRYIRSSRLHLETGFFCCFEKVTMSVACLEKLPCHVDFSHISSIALSIEIHVRRAAGRGYF